jgi:predicted Zn-dependent protease
MRSFANLYAGLPALIGALAVGVFVIGSRSVEENVARYRAQTQAAFKAKDYRTARLCIERLLDYDQNDRASWLALAECELALGEEASARQLLARLAPRDSAGYGPAEVRQAMLLLEGKPTGAQKREAIVYLRRALADAPNRVDIHALLARTHLELGQPEAAEPHLVAAARVYPEFWLTLANQYARRGDRSRTREAAAAASEFFAAKARPSLDDVDARLGWAQSLIYLEKFEQGAAVLKEQLAIREETRCRSALASVYAAWSESKTQTSPRTLSERFHLLEEGLRVDPENARVLQSLLTLLQHRGAEADKARAFLKQMMVAGQGSVTVCFVLGTDCCARGETGEGRALLEQASRLAPDYLPVANNLAWALSQGGNPDYVKALALADLAVDKQPKNPHFHDTRGRVLMRMGRWSEALQDLLLAHQGMPPTASMHQALMDAYAHLGMKELAEEHRKAMH